MRTITIYGQGYQSPGDGGDIETTISIEDSKYEEIKTIAKDLGMDVNELDFEDLPSDLQERMEKELYDEWGFSEGEEWHTFVTGFSIEK